MGLLKERGVPVCGFAGMFGKCISDEDVFEVQRMLKKVAHRGPDDQDFFVDRRVCLAQNGLAVVDLKAPRRPLGNEAGSLWIVADVEAYGAMAMRAQLRNHHRFQTETAAETILHLYEEYGPECVRRIDGAFAFALYDAGRRRLFMARDPLGVKPLYYGYGPDGTLYFASEIKALAAVTEDIREFPPGHRFDADGGLERYFRLPEPAADQSGQQLEDIDAAV